jgi:hypothetical protein
MKNQICINQVWRPQTTSSPCSTKENSFHASACARGCGAGFKETGKQVFTDAEIKLKVSLSGVTQMFIVEYTSEWQKRETNLFTADFDDKDHTTWK